MITEKILEIQELSVSFTQYAKHSYRRSELPVISGLNVTVHRGEIAAIVGSSGSGKSLLAHALFGLLPQNAEVRGRVAYQGKQLGKKDIEQLRKKEIALVPQSVNYLDPLMKVGMQITNGRKDAKTQQAMRSMLERYGLEERVLNLYPFELSGGMARRVLLMTALLKQPDLIIADEPTPGLELSLAKKAMKDFRDFADEGNGVLLITHDLELALGVADRVVVFYAGTTVEEANAADFLSEHTLRHPYTRALYRAMPQNGFQVFAGIQPYAKDMPDGCAFAPRCPYRVKKCGQEIPVQKVHGGTVKCIRYREERAEFDEA